MKNIILPAILAIIVCGIGYKLFFSNQAPGIPEPIVKDASSNKQAISQTNNQKIMNATLHTSMGDITIEFDNANTPNTVANFVKLAGEGFYDGTKFHRVIKGFMDQGGDPLSKDDTQMAMWGRGGPGYQFADEIKPTNSNDVGTIAMANAGPNTNGSQFFINAAPNHGLDTKHTVFGKVTSGLDVVMTINSTPTDSNDRPVTPVVIKSITLK
ncbi:MAG: peptidylprolyl isomerase [Patescibacteria group bacterium]